VFSDGNKINRMHVVSIQRIAIMLLVAVVFANCSEKTLEVSVQAK
jgi:hypothetical protein